MSYSNFKIISISPNKMNRDLCLKLIPGILSTLTFSHAEFYDYIYKDKLRANKQQKAIMRRKRYLYFSTPLLGLIFGYQIYKKNYVQAVNVNLVSLAFEILNGLINKHQYFRFVSPILVTFMTITHWKL